MYRILAVTWMVAIFWLSSQESLPSPDLFPGQDKLEHALAFGILGFLLGGALGGLEKRFPWGRVITVILLTGTYGLFDEAHQYFVPGREASLGDVCADLVGGFLAAMAFRWRRTGG